jgi:hypothetical protein
MEDGIAVKVVIGTEWSIIMETALLTTSNRFLEKLTGVFFHLTKIIPFIQYTTTPLFTIQFNITYNPPCLHGRF